MAATAKAPQLRRLDSDTIKLEHGYEELLKGVKALLPEQPDVSVHYEGLRYDVNVPNVQYDIPNVASECGNCLAGCARGLTCQKTPGTSFPVLDGVDGALRPGTMTLVLAPPGHGKSALLQSLSGKIPAAKLEGKITYSDQAHTDLKPSLSKMVAYMNQTDSHMALLTVRETLEFALRNAVVDSEALLGDADLAKAMSRRVDTVINLLSLQECAETVVGNDLIRGVSGGQKKRVTVGEVLITNARVLLLDEFSTGLDTSTTFDITASLRYWTRHLNGVLAASLLQPPPEVFDLFDDIILMREGSVVYHGPRDRVGTYFTQQGWVIPPDVDVADWLVEMLTDPAAMWTKQTAAPLAAAGASSEEEVEGTTESKAEEQAPAPTPAPAAVVQSPAAPPVTTAAMMAAWRAGPLHGHMAAVLSGTKVSSPVSASAVQLAPEGEEAAEGSPATTAPQEGTGVPLEDGGWLAGYVTPTLSLSSDYAKAQFGTPSSKSWGTHTWLNLERQGKLLLRNPIFLGAKLVQHVMLGLILGSLFFDLELEAINTKVGCLVFGLIHLSFSNFVGIPWALETRDVIQKQVALGFYPTSAFVTSSMLMNLPVAFLESLILGSFLYWMPGFVDDGSRFMIFIALLFVQDLVMANVFNLLAYTAPDMEAAQAAAGPFVGILVLFAGFLNTRSSIPDFMIWAYWISPFSWTARAAAVNEFTSDSYSAVVPGTGKTLGVVLLEQFEIQTEEYWVGAAFGYLIALFLLSAVITSYTLQYARYDVAIGTSRQEEAEESKGAGEAAAPVPFPKASLAFHNLGYTVKLADGTQRALLTDISGYVAAGSCTALCGVSGAGKSTLLDVLAGRKTAGKQTGAVFVNGKAQDKRTFARITAYVEQQDLHMPYTTVLEAVQFAAALRLDPATVNPTARAAIVAEVMHIMELNPLADRIVGEAGSLNALSPSQRKLLSIAIELVAQPSILFLDEPTSGLDSRAAASVMRVVRNIANTGRTVICTIHQPSKEVFLTSFDAMLLLKQGGHCVFFGNLGHDAHRLTDYLGTFPGVQPMAGGDNPATWMLDVIGGGTGTLTTGGAAEEGGVPAKATTDFGEAYASSALAVANLKKLAKYVEGVEVPEAAGSATAPSMTPATTTISGSIMRTSSVELEAPTETYATSFCTQFQVVLSRKWTSYWRNTAYNHTRLIIHIALGLTFGLGYQGVPTDTLGGIVSKLSLMFMAAAFTGLMNFGTSLPVLAKERAIYYRERSANMYNPEAYGLSVLLCELPYLATYNIVITTCYYWIAGLETDAETYFTYLLMHFLTSVALMSMGAALAAAFPDVQTAQMAGSFLVTMFFLHGGVFSPFPSTPAGWAWFRWVNPVAYAVNSLGSNQFFCDATPSVNAQTGAVSFNGCPTVDIVTSAGPARVPVWTFLQNTYDLDESRQFTDMGYVVIIYAVLALAFLLSLRFINHLKR